MIKVQELEEIKTIPQDELKQIKQNYQRGKYSSLSKSLKLFIRKNARKILVFKGEFEEEQKTKLTLEEAVRFFILDRKIIDLQSDIKEQLKEMDKELWYRGEKQENPNRDQTYMQWIKQYGAAWRIHRTREIVYVFNQSPKEYLGQPIPNRDSMF